MANSEPGSESAPPKSSNEIFLYLGDGLESGETGQLSQDEKVKDVGVVVDSTRDKETICDTGVSLNKNGILLTEAILVPDSKIPRRQTSVMFKLDDSNQESSDNEYHSNTAAQQHSNHNDDKSTGDSLRTHGSTVLSAQQSVDTQQTSQLLEETNKASQTPPSNVSKTDGSSAKKLSKSSKKGNRQGNSLVKVLSHHLSDRETSSSYVEDDDVSASNLHRFFNLRKLRGFTGSGNSNRSSKSTASRNRFRREKHMTMMLLSVTAAFLLSWVPPWFIYMTFIYKIPVFSDPILARVAHRHLDRIHLVSFVANPIIYYTFNPTFRTKAKELLRCLCCCCCRKRDAGESQG
ncbi:alpha-2B adrenergic receptor [Aplysia californica]|uniref:Alpha-2B adrenergic receptor n=1 Tax=Aplysia californica TaxID=6500 RepID=A0ABM0JIQ7_APLCA|nr:alpha-2B adrenergic receptor [Aplysia californica]